MVSSSGSYFHSYALYLVPGASYSFFEIRDSLLERLLILDHVWEQSIGWPYVFEKEEILHDSGLDRGTQLRG
ncbi:hypothetical protein Tco_0033039 [Tanacetum coccineum]